MFGDFLAAAVNQNVGAWSLSPLATEIECQAVRWMAELIGFPENAGGLFVSGGNMANFVGVLAARAAAAGWDVRAEGLSRGVARALRIGRDAHLDPEGRGPLRLRHQHHPLDSDRRRSCAWTWPRCAARSTPTGVPACSRSSSSAPPAR